VGPQRRPRRPSAIESGLVQGAPRRREAPRRLRGPCADRPRSGLGSCPRCNACTEGRGDLRGYCILPLPIFGRPNRSALHEAPETMGKAALHTATAREDRCVGRGYACSGDVPWSLRRVQRPRPHGDRTLLIPECPRPAANSLRPGRPCDRVVIGVVTEKSSAIGKYCQGPAPIGDRRGARGGGSGRTRFLAPTCHPRRSRATIPAPENPWTGGSPRWDDFAGRSVQPIGRRGGPGTRHVVGAAGQGAAGSASRRAPRPVGPTFGAANASRRAADPRSTLTRRRRA
jgi:hypothetical protein